MELSLWEGVKNLVQDRPLSGNHDMIAHNWRGFAFPLPSESRKAMPKKSALLSTPVDEATKAAFLQRARAEGITAAALLRRLVNGEIGAVNTAAESPDLSPGRVQVERVTVRMPGFVRDAAAARATSKGMTLSRWFAALAQSHLLKDPVLTDKEVVSLQAMSRELASIGRNINQIAKAYNTAIHGIERGAVSTEALKKMPAAIAVCRRLIERLVRSSLQGWAVEDGETDD